jgi:uncharacterized protein (DUF4415 family)
MQEITERRGDGNAALGNLGRRVPRRAVMRSVTVKPDLDARVIARMGEDGLSYSAVINEALRILFGEHAAQS